LSEATPRTIVGTEGTIKLLLSEYKVYKCFIILNNCALKILNCRSFFYAFVVYSISAFLKLIHFHVVCAFEEEINKSINKKTFAKR